MNEQQYTERKKQEFEEMDAILDIARQSTDHRVRYKWRRTVTDVKDVLVSSAELYGDKPYMLYKPSSKEPFRPISYRQLLEDVNGLGTALIELGLQGKHIGIIGQNAYQWYESYLSVICGTGVVVPLDKELSEDELRQLTIKGELSAVITMPKYCKTFENIKNSGETGLKCIIDVGHEEHDLSSAVLSWNRLMMRGKELVAAGNRKFTDAQIINTDLAQIMFTSGTTGTSKGVMLSHKNLVSNVQLAQFVLRVDVEDVFFSILPIHHAYENTCTYLESLYCGSTIAICRGLKYITKDMQEVKPTMLLAVPLIYQKFYDQIMRTVRKQGKEKQLMTLLRLNRLTRRFGLDLAKKAGKQILETFGGNIRTFIGGGAAIPEDVFNFFADLGIISVQGYGLTETAPMVALNPDVREDVRLAAAGLVIPGIECRIDHPDDDGIGEICFRGPNVMLGYYKDPENTAKAIVDGWFHTGDLGYLDADNYVYITGRSKNVIIAANGKNVFPEELESYINASPYVQECMVWADTADGVNSGAISITIQPSEDDCTDKLGADHTDEQLRELLQNVVDEFNRTQPRFKQIHHLVVRRRDFVVSSSMKIKRFVEDNRKA